jgi:hypothetical protein
MQLQLECRSGFLSLDSSSDGSVGFHSGRVSDAAYALGQAFLENPPIRRSVSFSAPRSARLLCGAVQPRSRDQVLSEQYGPSRPARSKPGRLAVQDTEFHPEDMQKLPLMRRANVNPTRIRVFQAQAPHGEKRIQCSKPTSQEPGFVSSCLLELLDLDGLKSGQVGYKWNISTNGDLWVGESAPIDLGSGRRMKQGHVTLVGGLPVPRARIGGVLRYDQQAKQFVIDNDSGRFSEHPDLTPQHLNNVAKLFKKAGLNVQTEWKDMLLPKNKRK